MTGESAIIIGVGERQGLGAAVAVKAAAEGLHVFIAGRTPEKLNRIVETIENDGGQATAVVTDSTQAEDIDNLFAQAAATGQPLRLVVYNTGRNLPAPFLDSTHRLIEDHWKRCTLGGFLAGQAALRLMLEQGKDDNGSKGTILYTGASASLRGKPMFAGFASAKAALRALAQSMAREFGPQGIHVGHIVIDGVVDGALIRSIGTLGKFILRQKGNDGALLPDEVAKSFWAVHQQSCTAWTHELDLRPYKEGF